jgi:hypothetical protein
MNKAVQIFLSIIAIGLASAAIVVFIQQLTGEGLAEYLYPCFLMGASFLSGCLAWNFGSDADSSEICSSDDVASESPSIFTKLESD